MVSNEQFDLSFSLNRVEAALVRVPIEVPVRTSFGVMHDRPTLLVRVTDKSGAVGYGEIWCNFPICGAAHRQLLVETELAPRAVQIIFETPQECYESLNLQLHILKLQTGEVGPIAQAIAGLDIAIWDMLARRAGVPVFELLGSEQHIIPTYASGINPVGVLDTVAAARNRGHKTFKLKVGFGDRTDRENVSAIAGDMGAGEAFLLDANQGWVPDAAMTAMSWIEPFQPGWIEEPMAVDVPTEAWNSLKASTSIPIAGGENFSSRLEYEAVAEQRWLDVVQPDIAKWGGFSECLPVAKAMVEAGLSYCPHSLGGGVALAASAHLLAVVGGPGLLECDANENEFRDAVYELPLKDGQVTLVQEPGLGVNVDILNQHFVRNSS